ncbi:MarR family winged helix-turn-helix transcriptional regulator [Vreelandella sp. H-I2]
MESRLEPMMSEDKREARAKGDKGARAELDLDQFLPYQLSSLSDRISEELSRLYQQRFSLNVAQWRVLVWLSHKDVLNAKEICETTRMDKARVSRAVQALVDRNLVGRTQSQRDQRLHDLRLTESGEALLVELVPLAQTWEAGLVSSLTAAEYRDLLHIMRKLERQLERLA